MKLRPPIFFQLTRSPTDSADFPFLTSAPGVRWALLDLPAQRL